MFMLLFTLNLTGTYAVQGFRSDICLSSFTCSLSVHVFHTWNIHLIFFLQKSIEHYYVLLYG